MTIIGKRNSGKVSRLVIQNDTVYLCGQVALDVTQDMAEQTKLVFARIDEHPHAHVYNQRWHEMWY